MLRFGTLALSMGLLGFGLGAAGCSSDGGSNGPENGNNETVEEVLDDFGVDIADTPRVDEDGDPLGEDYSPFGTMLTINKFSEVLLMGARLEGAFASAGQQPLFDLVPGNNNTFTPELLDDPEESQTPWIAVSGVRRDLVSADFDGDGLEETAVVYQEDNEPARLRIYQDLDDGFAIGEPKVVATQSVDQIVVVAGDFDGDVDEDLVIALISAAGIQVTLWENNDGELESTAVSFTIPVLEASPSSVHLILRAGNIDRDKRIELAAVVNEAASTNTSRYFVYDDARSEFEELQSGSSTATLPTESLTAVVADIALGDVDGDAMDEVVFGGLTAVGNTCNLDSFSVTQVLDDARHGLAPLAAHKVEFSDTRQPCSSGASHRLNFHPITLPDLDGDRIAEIHSFEFVYEDLAASPGVFTELHRIPQENLLTMGTSGSSFRFNRGTVSFAAGDVTSDRREDIVFYSQAGGQTTEQGIQIWGLDQIDGWKQYDFLPTDFENSSNSLHAKLLLPDVDLDQDSMSLEYSDGSYRLLFTEPIVLAALAAPPCYADGGGAVDDACRTAYGKSVTDTQERSDSASFIVGVSVGYEAEFSALGVKVGSAEAIVNTRNEGRYYGGEAYTLTTSLIRETGVLEDSVIFSTLPLDVYTYRILSHPNPELIGGEVQVRLPRTPITILATREFYNANIAEDGLPVDDSVFEHTPGDPLSYPSVAQRDQLLERYDGLTSDQADVGEGTGFTQVAISEFTETIDGREYSFEATLDLKATKGGVVGGMSFGGGFGFDISTRKGDETIYQGTVANLPADRFPQDAFSFGLFSYIVDDSSNPQPFEVLNYWVVPQAP